MQLPPPDPERDAGLDGILPATSSESALATASIGAGARPGDLSGSWRVMLGLAWVTAFFCYAGIWQASVQIGIGTWWVGPRAQPTHVAVKLIPFVLTLAMGLLVVYNVKSLVRWSAAGVVGAALVSLPDFSRSVGLGVAEAIIAGLLGLVTVASLSGRYRAAPSIEPLSAPPPSRQPPEPAPH